MDEGQKKNYRFHTIIILVIGIIIYLCLLRGQGGVNSLFIYCEKVYATDGRYNGLLVLKSEFSSDDENDESENTENVSYVFDEIRKIIINKSETPGFAQDTFVYESEGEVTLFLADGKRGLRVYNLKDIEKSNQPHFHTVLNLPDAKSMVIHKNTMYVAAGKHGVVVVDISKPKNPFIKYSYPLQGFVSDIDICIRPEFIAHPRPRIYGTEPPQPDTFTDYFEAIYLLVAAGDEGLVLINVEQPNLPEDYSKLEFPEGVSTVYVDSSDSSTHAFAGGKDGFYIVDFTYPTIMDLTGDYETEGPVQDIIVKDNLAYLAVGKQGLTIVDISKQSHPQKVGNIDTPGFTHDIELLHNYAFIADGEAGIRVIDVSNPKTPLEVGQYELELGEASLGRTLWDFRRVSPIENTIRRIAIDLGLWIIFLFLGLLFVVNFVWPIRSRSEHYHTARRVLLFWFGKQDPQLSVDSGKIQSKIARNPPSTRGVTVLDSNSAQGVHDKKGKPDKHRNGAGSIEKDKHPGKTADLRKQTILIGPKLGEDPFAFRLEGETIDAYKDRHRRRMVSSGQTSDKKEVVPSIRLVYAIDTSPPSGGIIKGGEKPVLEPSHRSVADQKHTTVVLHRDNRDPAPYKVNYLLINMITNLWSEHLSKFEFDDLFSDADGGVDPTALEKILTMMRSYLMQPILAELNEHGNILERSAGQQKLSHPAQIGLRILDITIEKVNTPESQKPIE